MPGTVHSVAYHPEGAPAEWGAYVSVRDGPSTSNDYSVSTSYDCMVECVAWSLDYAASTFDFGSAFYDATTGRCRCSAGYPGRTELERKPNPSDPHRMFAFEFCPHSVPDGTEGAFVWSKPTNTLLHAYDWCQGRASQAGAGLYLTNALKHPFDEPDVVW
mgnify:FL=1